MKQDTRRNILFLAFITLLPTYVALCQQNIEPRPGAKQPNPIVGNPTNPDRVPHDMRYLGRVRIEMAQQAIDKEAEIQQVTDMKDPAKQYAGIQSILLQRDAQASMLMQQLRSPERSKAFCAAYLIGELRLSVAIPALIDTIDIRSERIFAPGGESPLWGHHPIVEAIEKFGGEAVPPLISYLSTTDNDPIKRKFVMEALVDIEGIEPAIVIVSDRAKQETDTTRKSRLEVVVQEISKVRKAPDEANH